MLKDLSGGNPDLMEDATPVTLVAKESEFSGYSLAMTEHYGRQG